MKFSYSFEKMVVWQMTRKVINQIYIKTKNFPKEELFGITSQIRRAAVSISCNLSEGSARLGEKEQKRFYEIAFGSAIEVINLLIISHDLELLAQDDYEYLRNEMEKLTFQMNKLIHKKPPDQVNEPDAPYGDHP
jgi:four helix bundle protein